MTRDQMHNTLRYVREQLANERGTDYSGVEALDMVLEELEQEPSGDLISRQAVLNTLDRMDKALDTDRTVESYKELLTECYKDLPSVKQEAKAEQFAKWVAEEIFDDLWEDNPNAFDGFAELACRKLEKLGIVRAKDGEWELVEPQERSEE